jgi:hypothetical protein
LSSCVKIAHRVGPGLGLINLLGATLALFLAWLLFRGTDPTDDAAWDGVAMASTQELLAADGDEAAQIVADLWQLDAERDQAMGDD